MNEKMIRRQIRRSFHPVSWSLVVYYIIMNVAVGVVMFVDIMIGMIKSISAGGDLTQDAVMSAASNGWGYILAGIAGLVILLCWKGKRFWKEEIWAKGRPVTFGGFCAMLALVIGCQMAATIGSYILELILNQFGLSIQASMESATVSVDTFSLWLYMAVWAPVTEELLFRGLIQRLLLPYGKRFAIFASAFLFGIFHGNLIQSPYAFLVGLILGYVACEHSIAWAMLLHMINNMVVADMLNRVLSFLPEMTAGVVIWLVLLAFAVAALVILIAKREKIRQWRTAETVHKTYLSCFFTSFGMVAFTVIIGLMMIYSFVIIVSPL